MAPISHRANTISKLNGRLSPVAESAALEIRECVDQRFRTVGRNAAQSFLCFVLFLALDHVTMNLKPSSAQLLLQYWIRANTHPLMPFAVRIQKLSQHPPPPRSII